MTTKLELKNDASVLLVCGNKTTGASIKLTTQYANADFCPIPEPTLLFPPEPSVETMDPLWFATNNPRGVPAVHTAYIWSVVVSRQTDGTAKFYLRDECHVVHEVTYGHCHHAIYFADWSEYETALKQFYEDKKTLEEKFGKFVSYVKERFGKDSPEHKEAKELDCYRANNFTLWVSNYHPEHTRLHWAIARMEEAEAALKAKRIEIFKPHGMGTTRTDDGLIVGF